MSKAKILDIKGKVLEEKVLDAAIFDVEPKESVLKQAYVRYLANMRGGNAKTKTRGEVRGGGKKPWRQKGTGRARTGSSRNPIWRTGGVVFGPTGTENYEKAMNKKTLRLALKMALSQKAKDGRVFILDKLTVSEPKTKKMREIFDALPIEKRVLLVSGDNLILFKSVSNLKDITFSLFNQLNVFDAMTSDYIVILKEAYDKVVDFYKSTDRIKAKKKEAVKKVTKESTKEAEKSEKSPKKGGK